MASIALHLKSQHHRPSQTLLRTTTAKLTFSHLFSSSSSSDDDNNSSSNNNSNNNNDDLSSYLSNIKSKLKKQHEEQFQQQQSPERFNFTPQAQGSSTFTNNVGNSPEKSYPFSTYLTDIKSKLKQHEEQRQSTPPGFRHSNFTPHGSSHPSKAASLDRIKQNLSEFRIRSSDHSPEFPSPSQQPSLSRNVGNPNPDFSAGNVPFDAVRESLRQLKATGGEKRKNMSKPMSLNSYQNSGKMQQTMPGSGGGITNKVIGGSVEDLPRQVFGREMKEKETKQGKEDGGAKKEVWMKSYSYDDLGEKLRMLRPDVKGKKGEKDNWVSELNERLQKLMEIEEKESIAASNPVIRELRNSLSSLADSDGKDKSKMAPILGFDILGPPSFMLSPPKEHLVEKYFHPDNMSAEEKVKLELKKVRDEFKMHESDCGSARVQIAQLTTEILHLSSVLHKKDKHSRRGLQAKVQQRKKLLKYLRRTDWESYCFVLSKLGLRDNPDYKN